MRIDLVNKLRYLLERQFVKGTPYQLLVMAALVGLISVAGGLLAFGTGAPGEDLADAVWWAFLRLTDPGYLGDDEGAWRRTVSTVLTVSGYVVFMGALIAILTRWLISLMQELELGLTPVAMRHHIVILGWTNRTLPIVRELLLSQGRMRRFFEDLNAGKRLRLVVLIEELGPELSQELRSDAVTGKHLRQIVLRSGSPLNPEHLNRAACLDAAAVIVPARTFVTDSGITSDIETIKALLSLDGQAQSEGAPRPYVVAEIQDPRKIDVARHAYGGRLEVVAGDASISRLMVQNVRHPGLSTVYTELLSQDIGSNLYLRRDARYDGRRFDQLTAAMASSIPCGVVRAGARGYTPHLNPPDDFAIEPGDAVVLIARSFDTAGVLSGGIVANASTPVQRLPAPAITARRVLILGWSRKVPALLHEFATYGRDSFLITLLSTLAIDVRRQILADEGLDDGRLACQHLDADFTNEQVLRRTHPESFDCIMLISSDRLGSGEEADARSIMAYLSLERMLEQADAQPQILMEFSDPHNERLMGNHTGEVIISPLLLSHILAQVTLRRELRPVLDALFSAGGPEISFRPPGDYAPAPAHDSFHALQGQARAHGEIVLGILRAGARPGTQRSCQLNPPRGVPLQLAAGDELIVLIET